MLSDWSVKCRMGGWYYVGPFDLKALKWAFGDCYCSVGWGQLESLVSVKGVFLHCKLHF